MPDMRLRFIPARFFPALIAFMVFVLIILLGETLLVFDKSDYENKQRIDSLAYIASLRARFERELNSLIYLNSGISSYLVVKHNNLHDKELYDILGELHQSNIHIKNFGIAVGYRLKYIYPLKGNEKAVGMYYPDQPKQWLDIQKIVESRKPSLLGPISLVQGGRGMIYRIPIFIKGNYWGLLSTVIDADSLFKAAFTDNADGNYLVAIRNETGVILGNPAQFDNPLSVMQSIAIPGGLWEMTVMKNQTSNQLSPTSSIRLTSIMLAAFFSWLSFYISQSRRKLSQLSSKLNSLYELSPLGIALTDMQGRYVDFNQAFQNICGYSRDELNQLDYWELTPKEYADEEAKQLESLRTTGYYGPYEKEYIRKDHSRIPLRLNGLLLHGMDGKDYIWSIVENISESRKIDKMKSEFVSTVSHELRTPLTSISGALGLISSGALGKFEPQIQSMLDIAYRNSQRLNHLINDLLDIEKLIAGEMTFNIRKQPLRLILQSTLESVSAYARQYNVEFIQSGCTDNDFVMVDNIRLQQVLNNLLSNAAKFSPAGSQIRIVTQSRDNKLRISVIDNGPGIPEEFRTRIFTKFSQADSSDTRQKGGTGLGLAISKELIERMQGTIGYLSTAGQGTCFYIELPAIAPDAQ